jgi:hypothetical protein
MSQTTDMAPQIAEKVLKQLKETADLVIDDTQSKQVIDSMVALGLGVSMAIGMMTGFAEALARLEREREAPKK